MQPNGPRTKGRQVILISLVRSDKNEKGSSISARALNMAEVDWAGTPEIRWEMQPIGLRTKARQVILISLVRSDKTKKAPAFLLEP